ncbi:MAG: glycosyltransferase [Paludibacteraceae bacterium]|nr:glycosyltransferase [Paludibacteraceae bacterium]
MIPKIIHYCWFGGNPLPELEQRCLASWHEYMPDWEYKWWNEETFDIAAAPLYVQQAYEARKYAFVSDYVRLWALEQYGGLYMDVDFEVFRPFDELMDKYPAFAGYEGSKRKPVMMGVLASEPHGAWVRDMLSTYENRSFIKPDGSLDMTPNTSYFSDRLEAQGFVADGTEKDFYVKSISNFKFQISNLEERMFFLHVFPVHYFCPLLTTGENIRNEETYCEHLGESSWAQQTWKGKILSKVPSSLRTKLIKLKRRIWG